MKWSTYIKMVFDTIYGAIRKKYPKKTDEVLIVGISGSVASGKSAFTRELFHFIEPKGITPITWGGDYYQASREERLKRLENLKKEGKTDKWIERIGRMYFDVYEWNLMFDHMEKIKRREDIEPIKLYQRKTGKWDKEVNLTFKDKIGPVWCLYNGVFLLDQRVRPYIDQVIFLDADREVRFRRAAQRASRQKEPYTIDREKFMDLDSFISEYISDYLNKDEDIVIDNNDFRNRKIKSLPRMLSP